MSDHVVHLLNPGQAEVLETLRIARKEKWGLDGWVRPMDIGGRDSSHHSKTLKRLVRLGLAEKQLRGTLRNEIGGGRGSYRYRAKGTT